MLEDVDEEAAGHAGGPARQLAHAVEEARLYRVQAEADVDGRDEHQEATAIHVLQGVRPDDRGGHDGVFGAFGPVFRRGFSARCYLCHRLRPLPTVITARPRSGVKRAIFEFANYTPGQYSWKACCSQSRSVLTVKASISRMRAF